MYIYMKILIITNNDRNDNDHNDNDNTHNKEAAIESI